MLTNIIQMDPGSISAIIISSLTALASCLVALHIKRMKSGCLECETQEQKRSRPNSVNKSDPSTTV